MRLLVVVLALWVAGGAALRNGLRWPRRSPTALRSSAGDQSGGGWAALPRAAAKVVVASAWLLLPPAGMLLVEPDVTWAAGDKGSSVGTKGDKSFELCVSKCVFAETRPPPIGSSSERLEAKDRPTVISDCRKSCAKTKEQLLLGSPKKPKAE